EPRGDSEDPAALYRSHRADVRGAGDRGMADEAGRGPPEGRGATPIAVTPRGRARLLQGVQIGRDVASFPLAYAHRRHDVLRVDGVRVLDPGHQVGRRVPLASADVEAARERLEGRPDLARRARHAGDLVTTAAGTALDVLAAR